MGPRSRSLFGGACLALSLWARHAPAAQIVEPITDATTSPSSWQDPYRVPTSDPELPIPTWTSGSDATLQSGTSGGALRPSSLLLQSSLNAQSLEPLSTDGSSAVLGVFTQEPAPVPLPAAWWLFASGAALLGALKRRPERSRPRWFLPVKILAEPSMAGAAPLTHQYEVSRA